LTAYISLARVHVKLYTGKTGTILATVVLFFHHEVHLVDPIKGSAILLFVILKGLKQAYY